MAHLNIPQNADPLRCRLLRAIIWAVLCLGFVFPVSAAPSQPSLEEAVKASYLFKFAPFILWPDRAFSGAKQPFAICIIGEDPFGAALDDVIRAEKISNRPIVVRRLGASADEAGCQILFAGRSTQAGAYAPFSQLGGQPVLTVTDQASGVSGAMVKFVMQGGRVRFQIDDAAARANGLIISSKLLGLAISVNRE